MIELINIKKSFKQMFKTYEVLKGVSIKIDKEIFAFLGPNGAGKTTTIKIILTFLKPDEGEVKILGKNPFIDKEIFKYIGYAPEQAFYYDYLTGLEFLMFMGKLSGNVDKKRSLELLELFGLGHAYNKFVKSYSKGMKQRLGLAASLINDPLIIFWDEPMSGLDPLGRMLVKNIIKDLKNKGKLLFFNTHILSDVEEVADRFAIINDGKIIYNGTINDIKENLEEFFYRKIKENTPNLFIK